ncbi:MAG: MFS transporter [Candidatus Pacebacteria bacterium]|jgi:MFS family permease|nr:MFS transporter [Candidatus Paceibacterota bacterium]MBT3511593.1 MFS transporter [Candidatus Paceibacterota bacterium]MBT4004937.1 MFS transporter [Candidatus Paceibacterota bacterium]MBT4358713.1 MFS transporter [Candidatus Paceibacterota bacterium]MBT4680680.1 MFS transporter [Candidatus Paceibacterota bacterium]
MHRNLKIGYALAFINELYFPVAIWLLFFLKYLDFTQVAILGALTTVSSNLFEIPTGAIADILGRKWTLFWSFIISSIGLLVISTGSVFSIFAIGRIINGLGHSLLSGTHESLMYDTLKSAGKVSKYEQVVSKKTTLVWIGLFLSSILGGIIYDFWNVGPFVISAGVYVLAAILCLFIQEPEIDSETFSLANYVKQNTQGFYELFKNKRTTQITLLLVTISAGYFFAAKILGISQAEQYGMSGKGVGLLFGVGFIIAAIASHYYPVMKNKFGNLRLLAIATLLLLTSFIFAKFVGVILGSLLIITRIASSTSFGNAKSVVVNGFISSKNRATSLSTLALLSQIPFAVSFYFVGKYIDNYSPNSFAFLLGILLIVFLVPQLFLARKILFRKE